VPILVRWVSAGGEQDCDDGPVTTRIECSSEQRSVAIPIFWIDRCARINQDSGGLRTIGLRRKMQRGPTIFVTCARIGAGI
jgi:hypothetical protein